MEDFTEERHQFMKVSPLHSEPISSRTTDTINVSNMTNYGFLIGDYIMVNDEIMRIKTTVSHVSGATQLKVFRGVYGSIASTHENGL